MRAARFLVNGLRCWLHVELHGHECSSRRLHPVQHVPHYCSRLHADKRHSLCAARCLVNALADHIEHTHALADLFDLTNALKLALSVIQPRNSHQ